MIEAGGGGRSTTSKDIASSQAAFVRIRTIDHRNDLLECIMPNYKLPHKKDKPIIQDGPL